MNNPNAFTQAGTLDSPEANGNSMRNNTQEEQKANSANSTYSSWEEPVIPERLATPEISADLLPGWLGEYADAVSRNTQTPQGLSVMMSLGIVATCIQKRFEVCPYGDDYREPLSLWTATAMPPASRKTAVVNALTGPLVEWESHKLEDMKSKIADIETKRAVNQKAIERLQNEAAKSKSSAERGGLIDEINQLKAETPEELLAPRLWTGDVTPERLQNLMAEHGARMGLISDEGGIFEIMAGLYSDGRANIDVFLQSHAGKDIRVDRGQRTVCLNKPALSFALAVQPEVLCDFGRGNKRRFRGIGALARFLYCIPKSNIGSRDIRDRRSIPETVKRRYREEIFNLLETQPLLDELGVEQPRMLSLSPSALHSWEEFSQRIESKQGDGREFEPIQDWTGKLPGAALRIAGICHVAEHGETSFEINLKTMERALNLCALLIPHAQVAFDMMGADESVADAKVVLRWILKNGELSFKRSACHKANHGRFKKVDRLIKALEVLQGWNVISDVDPVKTENSSKPILLYHVNPEIFKGDKDGMA